MAVKVTFLLVIALLPYVESMANKSGMYSAITWDVKPYIYFDDEGKPQGMFPKLMSTLESWCFDNKMRESYGKLMHYETPFKNWTSFYKNFTSGVSDNNTRIFYVPFLQDHIPRESYFQYELYLQTRISIIARRDMINFPTRLIEASYNSLLLLVLLFLCTLIFGMLVGMIERHNDPVASTFTRPYSGIWWSFVTLTTVGYGDTYPRSCLGRCIAVVWMLISMFMYSALTSFVVQNITSGFYIDDRTLAVFNNSFAADYAKEYNKIIAVAYEDYEQIFDAVVNHEADVAFVSADIAMAWAKTIRNKSLHVVGQVPGQLTPYMLTPNQFDQEPDLVRNFWACTLSQQDAVLDSMLEYHGAPIEKTLYLSTLEQLPQNYIFITTTTALAFLLLTSAVYKVGQQLCNISHTLS